MRPPRATPLPKCNLNDSFASFRCRIHSCQIELKNMRSQLEEAEALVTAPQTAPITPRYAILFRGQSHRFGCDKMGVFLQTLMIHTHHAMISEPLEARGYVVDVFTALNPACTVSEMETSVSDSRGLHSGRRVYAQSVRAASFDQASNMRSQR